MKRKALLIMVVAVTIFALIKILGSSGNKHTPRFIPGTPASIPSFKWSYYDFLADVPFANDKLWMWTGNTNLAMHAYLYDLRQRTVTGELTNAGLPQLCSRDGSQILVVGKVTTNSGMWAIFASLQRMFLGNAFSARTIETLWILDLPNNSATRIGTVSQFSGGSSSWHSSPDFRYGFNMPTSMGDTLVLCDFEKRSLKEISVKGYPVGWWSEREILIDTLKNEFELLNVETRTTKPLFKTADIQEFMARAALTNSLTEFYPVGHWNGSNYDFFFGSMNQVLGLGGNGYLAKANRADPSLELVSTNFEYRWGGIFDTNATHYLYPGESGPAGSSGDGAVYLRNLEDGTVKTVVPAGGKSHYSIPRFYGNEIIYFRDSVLHRVALDGTGDSLLLTNSATVP